MIAAVELIPSARKLIMSLRDMGYDFTQAVADIVDNSIEARASLVHIDLEFDGDESWVRISDNGKGMKPDVLREAMRYGAESDYEEDSLGKFGLGLKTASMSQCQKLTVASRWNPERADIAAYCWDLNHIEKTNRWEIIPIDRNGLGPPVLQPLKSSTGTVVLWQQLDRILGYKLPYGEFARKRMTQLCRDLESHLGMVFHRFISGEERRRKVKIFVNGNEVKSWDPFCRVQRKTQKLQDVKLQIDYEGIKGEVLLEPYILPHQEDFGTQEEFRLASGPLNWNQQQGIYVYRSGRMIQSGGWCRLRAPDEHTKLARVALFFNPKLDEAFKVNVAKMRVQLPSQIRDEVDKAIAPVVKLARERYDKRTPNQERVIPSSSSNAPLHVIPLREITTSDDTPRESPSRENTSREINEIGPKLLPIQRHESIDPPKLSFDEIQSLAIRLAKPEEQEVVARVFERIHKYIKEAKQNDI